MIKSISLLSVFGRSALLTLVFTLHPTEKQGLAKPGNFSYISFFDPFLTQIRRKKKINREYKGKLKGRDRLAGNLESLFL
jgi:hypothetical protein